MSVNSLVAQSVASGPATQAPLSFNGDPSLFMFNLFLMTAMFFLGAMMAGKQGGRIWQQRRFDHPLDPITIYRLILMFAGTGISLRCGAEAMYLWSWNPDAPAMVARTAMAKRWLDPIACAAGAIWMTLAILGEPGIEHQLRKAPLPVDMWSRWPALARALGVVMVSFVAAFAAVVLR
ncbi:hypothetical protein PQ455_07480 [Sphingomonas naphthae]|uniref:DUF3995 domain-containing protein n=1 Tax=Sphingomonas naphthae TaxID=1813468 RepID=A0ABY7TP80_9SPHN|nr:hypothetical protein [Sphingomonas naphthae]WCT75047.1 hypothetical protein PQ455_07480 [Sphingomonas naphthae]